MSKKGKIFFFVAVVSIACFALIFGILGTWIPFLWAPIAFTALSLPLWIYYDKALLVDFFSMRTTKNGMSMGVMILLVFLIVGLVNFIGARKYKTFDFSIARQNSISDQSQKVIQQLKSPLQIYFFYKPGVEGADQNKLTMRRLVGLYQDLNSQVKFDVININENPKLAQEFKVQSGKGEAFVVYQGKNNKVDRWEEQDLTNAILKTLKEKKPVVYFTEGHGEKSIKDSQNEMSAYSLAQLLEKNSYEVRSLSFLQKAEVPADADAVVVAGPSQNFQTFEWAAFEQYLQRGGQLILALDPEKPPVMQTLLDSLGVKMNSHYVFNLVNTPYGTGVDQRVPTVGSVYSATHPITKVFKENEVTKFAFVGSLETLNKSDFQYDILVKTNPATVTLASLESKAPESNEPKEYNLALAVSGVFKKTQKASAAESEKTAEDKSKKFQVVVFADSDFFSSILLAQNLNRDLFMNSLAYLVNDTDLISISAKEPGVTKMMLTPTASVSFFILFMCISLAFLLISLILYFRRKNA